MRTTAIFLVFFLISGLITPIDAKPPDIPRSEKAQLVLSDKTSVQSEQKEKEKKFNSLVEKAKKNGKVRVIVELDIDFIPEGYLKSKNDVQKQRDKIKDSQNSIIQSLKKEDYDLIHKFKYIPLVTLNVNENALKHFENNPKIKSIHEDKLNKFTVTASVPLIGADTVHSIGFSGSGQAVAILDTGVDSTHSWLSGKVVSEACYSTTDVASSLSTVCPNGQAEQVGTGSGAPCSVDGCFHGTHVAGIAAGNDGSTNKGVGKDASIIAIQVSSRLTHSDCISAGFSSPCAVPVTTDVIKGLERVFELRNSFNIAAVNLSLGGGAFTAICDGEPHKPAIDQLRSVGIATVVASGNDGFVNALSSPACISSAVSVGSTDVNSHSSGFTTDDVSPFTNSASFLDLLAPGALILSSIPGGSTALFEGTSQAAPHVVGAWAILKQRTTNASVPDILNDLKNTGVPITDPGNDLTFPRIQLNAAISDVAVAFGSNTLGCEETLSCYQPFQFSVNQGDEVVWYNGDSATHTVTSGTPAGGPDGLFDSGLFLAGDLFSHTFETTKTVNYFCMVHPWMTSQIVVNAVPCAPPGSGDWIISSSCTLSSSSTAPGNVIIQNNSVLTIPAGMSLDINFVNNFLRIESGSGLLIKAGAYVS